MDEPFLPFSFMEVARHDSLFWQANRCLSPLNVEMLSEWNRFRRFGYMRLPFCAHLLVRSGLLPLRPLLHFRPGEAIICSQFGMSRSVVNCCLKNQIENKIGATLPWYESQQVFYLYRHLVSQEKLGNDLSRFGQLMVAQPFANKGLMSAVYGCLMDRDLTFPVGYQKAWHVDLGKSIPKEAWDTL